MEIKVDAQLALDVLADNGIDVAQAKAIIFDLLQASASPRSARDSLKEAKEARVYQTAATVPTSQTKVRETSPPVTEADEEEVELAAPVTTTKVAPQSKAEAKPNRSKRLSFTQFGGPADGLRYTSGD